MSAARLGARARPRAPRREGSVALVGAGPGDAELLTLRARRLIRAAGVIVHDHLVAPEILALAPRAAKRIYAGKERGLHTMRQEQINALLVKLAREGRRVVRLKGGDPFIFGRGGEEAEALAEAGIAFEVVPGITAAAGVSAYAGIPLTHRQHASYCTLVAGHLKDGSMALDWRALARDGQTVVVYMGLHGLEQLCRELIAAGRPARTPAAIVQHGTMRTQRVVAGTLQTLPRLAAEARIAPPTIIIVGEVVRLQPKLDWFRPASPAKRSAVRRRTPRPRRASSD